MSITRVSNDELIINIVQARGSECHGIIDILIENGGLVIRATCDLKLVRMEGSGSGGAIAACGAAKAAVTISEMIDDRSSISFKACGFAHLTSRQDGLSERILYSQF